MKKRTIYPPHLLARVKELQKRIRKLELDALLVSNRYDVRYLTGFVGEDSWVLVRSRAPRLHVLSDFRFDEQIQREAPHVEAVMRDKSLALELAKLARCHRLERIGVQGGHTTLAQRKALLRPLKGTRLAAVDDGLLEQRSVKDEKEVVAIQRAVRITQEAFRRTIDFLRPGQTEGEIAAYLEYQARLLGADGVAFPSIVAADANSSLPHAIPGGRRVREGGLVLFDWGAVVAGYCADLTRPVALGRMKPVLREIYQIVLDAHDAAIESIRPGADLKQVDAVARDLIDRAGYGDRFGHSLGHGIGLMVHEQPRLSRLGGGHLRSGHVVTVEPGIYLPGVGGIRIESDVLVTPRGRRVLSDLPTDLESAII